MIMKSKSIEYLNTEIEKLRHSSSNASAKTLLFGSPEMLCKRRWRNIQHVRNLLACTFPW